MRKPIPENVKEKLNRIKTAIEDVPNTVPNEMRTTFNFKGRKSPDIAEKVIQTVCDKEDIFYDPFMGSGSFVYAAMGHVNQIYATELDNYTFNAVSVLMNKVDLLKLGVLFDAVKVYFKEMKDEEIEKWLDTGKAMDKAGAYGIQTEFGVYVEKIEGNYTTAVGLPIHKVYDIINEYI